MMSRFFCLVSVVMITLFACGCTEKPLSGGTYVLSRVGFSQDECNMKETFSDKHEITLTVNDNTVTIDMAGDVTPLTGMLISGKFTAFSSKADDVIPDTDCRDMWIKNLTGTLLKKNVFTAVYEFNDKTVSGADCSDEEKIGFYPPRCTSTITFTATKK